MAYADPIRQAEYNKKYLKQHYQNNKDYYYQKNKRKRKERVDFINEFKKGKLCTDCKIQYPSYVMDFDHREGEKKGFTISTYIRRSGVAFKKIIEEIAKCDLVCSNCHRIRTYNRMIQSGVKVARLSLKE